MRRWHGPIGTIWLLLGLILWMGAVPANQDRVWCRGTDGHSALESLLEPCCVLVSRCSGGGAALALPEGSAERIHPRDVCLDASGPCTDILLSQYLARTGLLTVHSRPMAATPWWVSPVPPALRDGLLSAMRVCQRPFHPPPLADRTVLRT